MLEQGMAGSLGMMNMPTQAAVRASTAFWVVDVESEVMVLDLTL
jgi:hypothetical protein